jgi:hypothetical protein
MNESQQLASQMERALNGGAWHGPSWREALDGINSDGAQKRPIPRAHTVAEIVNHATTWHDVVRLRLEGERPQVSDAEDWPSTGITDEAAWMQTVGRFFESGRMLHETVGRFPPERIHERRPGLDDTWFDLIIGELQHMLYHAGQVVLLRKAI